MARFTLSIAAAALLFGANACGRMLTFDATVRVPPQRIEPVTPGALGALLPADVLPAVPVRLRETRAYRDQDAGSVRAVRLRAMTLSLTGDSVERNFDFLDSIHVDARPIGGGRAIHVAGLDIVPRGADTLHLTTTGNDLADALGADFELIFDLAGRFPAHTAAFEGTAVFRVDADPKGLF